MRRVARDPLFTRRFLALWLFAFGVFFVAFQLLPVFPLRIEALGGSKTLSGAYLTVYTLASALSAPLMGTIADRVGRKRMLIAASSLFIAFSLLYAVVTPIPALLVIGVVHGSLWSAILASSSAIMTEIIPVSRRTQGLAFWGLASTAAIAIAPAVGIEVYRRIGWTGLCLEMAVVSAVMALWATRLPAHVPQHGANPPSLAKAWDWSVISTALSFSTIAIGYGGVTSYVAMLSIERHIHPPSLFFTVSAISIAVIRMTASHLGDRYGTRAILFPAFAAIPVAFVLLAYAQTRAQLVVAAIVFGVAMGSAFPAFMSFLVGSTDEKNRARTFGSFVLAFDTGIGLGSLIMGAIAERRGLGFAFLVAAAISCLAIPVFAMTSRRLARGTAVAADPEHAGP
jgi:MFS family permease